MSRVDLGYEAEDRGAVRVDFIGGDMRVLLLTAVGFLALAACEKTEQLPEDTAVTDVVVAPSEANYVTIDLTEPQVKALADLKMAAEAIDESADPKGSMVAWQAVKDYLLTIYPEPHPEVSLIDMQIAVTFFYVGEMTKAAAAFENQIAVLEGAGPKYESDLIELYNNVGVAYNYLSRHEDARKNAQLVLDYRKAEFDGAPDPFVLGDEAYQLATAYNNLAASDMELALYDSAISNIGEAIRIADKMKSPPPTAALWYANLPVYLRKAGRDQEAIIAARKAAIKIEALLPENHPFGANNLSNLGVLLIEQGKLGEAERVTRKALDIASAAHGRESEQAAAFQIAMAQILLSRGQDVAARQFGTAAQKTLLQTSGANSGKEILARQKISSSFRSEDLGRAIDMQMSIVTDWQESVSGENRELIVAREILADYLLQAGRFAEAKTVISENAAFKSTLYSPSSAEMLVVKSQDIFADAGLADDTLSADRLMSLYDDVRAKDIATSVSTASLSNNSIYINDIYGNIFLAAVASNNETMSFQIAQRMLLSAAGTAVTKNQLRESLSKPRSRKLLREIQDLAEDRLSAERIYSDLVLNSDEEPLTQQQAIIERLDSDIAAKTTVLLSLEDGLSDQLTAVDAPVSTLQKELGEHIAQIGYLSFRDRLYAVLLTREQVMTLELDGRVKDLKALSDRVRASVALPGGGETLPPFDAQASHDLYNQLFPEDIKNALSGITTLEIIPSAVLDDIPFSLLQTDAAQNEFLIDRMAVSMSPKFGVKRTTPRRKNLRSALSMIGVSGDFDVIAPLNGISAASQSMFDESGARSLAALPRTKNEINEIAKALNTEQATLLSGADSTEAEFRRLKIEDIDIFAFATHAVMADEFEGLDEPALVFNRTSVSEGSDNDGLLTSSEITKLSLNADWVILSACNTAAPNEAGAASYEGLTRAFLYAGADSLLVSHWPVRDDAAAFLTVNTVRYSQDGFSKAEALQKAIMDIRQNKDIPNSEHPAIWAPFVLIGNG